MKRLFAIAVIILVFSLLAISCAPPQRQTIPGSSDNATEKPPPNTEVDLPPMPDPDKGNPKLDTFLSQLILAEKRGEAEAYAKQRIVNLVDGKVRVQIEAAPGQLDAAANVTAAMGIVEIVERDFNHVQAVISIPSLTALAEEKSIKFIRRPVTPSY